MISLRIINMTRKLCVSCRLNLILGHAHVMLISFLGNIITSNHDKILVLRFSLGNRILIVLKSPYLKS